MKNNYERIEHETLKFTTKWVGAFIAEVSDDVDDDLFIVICYEILFNSFLQEQ